VGKNDATTNAPSN